MGRQKIEISEQVRAVIVSEYDGSSDKIDDLVARFGLERHQIGRIAKQGGYVSNKDRRAWTDDEDTFLKQNWHWLSVEEVAVKLNRSVPSVLLRKKRIGIGRFDEESMLNIRELETATKIDHRFWHEFIERGWLKARQKNRCNGAAPITRVAIDDLKKFLVAHPEIIDYANTTGYTRALIEADSLPAAPRYKLVTCQSDSWNDGIKATPIGPKFTHGAVQLADLHHEFSLPSCKASGGTDFWVPLYESAPSCPRCGCKVSRFSERVLYRDDTPDDAETIDAIAQKIGLKWSDGAFRNESGEAVNSDELLRYVFSTGRSPGKAVRVFHKLLKKGMTVIDSKPVDPARLLEPIVGYSLLPLQQAAFDEFVANGALSVEYWPGFGKMYLSAYAMTCMQGNHVVFVNTKLVGEQWVAHLQRHLPRIEVQKEWKPSATRVRVYDRNDQLRCTIRIYSYATRHHFDNDDIAIAVYDESQFLPGNLAHRKALIGCEFRIGLSASPWREDGREELIGMLTGNSVGRDWEGAIEEGLIQDVPVTVYLVRHLNHKHQLLARLCAEDKRTIVFSDGRDDGLTISARLGIPFVYGESKNRLQTVYENKTVCLSRVGDCGIDVRDLQRAIEFSFHGGARAQSLQRFGRLLHSEDASEHIVLMTDDEYERYEKRLRVLRDKGFKITVKQSRYRQEKTNKSGKQKNAAATWLAALGVTPLPMPTTSAGARRIVALT